jgi:hypothetical protein
MSNYRRSAALKNEQRDIQSRAFRIVCTWRHKSWTVQWSCADAVVERWNVTRRKTVQQRNVLHLAWLRFDIPLWRNGIRPERALAGSQAKKNRKFKKHVPLLLHISPAGKRSIA